MYPIKVYEVGPRDGLQNWEGKLSTDEKVSMINDLYDAGLTDIEITSFVHPKWVPNSIMFLSKNLSPKKLSKSSLNL